MRTQRPPIEQELTQEDMLRILADRVRRLYGLSLNEYLDARRAGTLPHVPGAAALEVFSGETASADGGGR